MLYLYTFVQIGGNPDLLGLAKRIIEDKEYKIQVLSYVNSIIYCNVDTKVGKFYKKDRGNNYFILIKLMPIKEFVNSLIKDFTYVAYHYNIYKYCTTC